MECCYLKRLQWLHGPAGRSVVLSNDDLRVAVISERGPGYSHGMHYRFFRQVLAVLPTRDAAALMLGVYFARDLMMIADLLDREFTILKSNLRLIGVDKFEDAPCDDWPSSARKLGWQAAGFGQPPDLQSALNLLNRFSCGVSISLAKEHAETFLASLPDGSQDWIYIDTAHDYASTKQLIIMCLPKLKPAGIISGDDYADSDLWGVKRAVTELIPSHSVWERWIWYAQNPT
jgi:hypothetical protein